LGFEISRAKFQTPITISQRQTAQVAVGMVLAFVPSIMSKPELNLLNYAFSEFTKASDSLMAYYHSLETQIRQLKEQVEEKNNQLEKARKYLHTILDSLPVGVVVLEKGPEPVFSNKNAKRLNGAGFIDSLKSGGETFGELKNRTGCFRWRREALNNGFEGREVVVFEDVTQMERMKERLERDERLRAMGEMAARIAHEIKNPLGSMELFLSMLQQSKLRKVDRKYVEHVLFGVKAVDRVINNILSYTRPKTLVLQEESLADLVKDTVQFMKVSIKSRDISIRLEMLHERHFVFDPDLMKLVMMNLFANAMDAIEEKGCITIGIKEERGYVVVSVCDDGVGMAEEVRKNLFNPFFTTKDKGVGLGLFIVYNIVKAHAGYIEVESQPGVGSTFLIYLPEKRI
jgi:two-component system sensor histidine kinase FlrB